MNKKLRSTENIIVGNKNLSTKFDLLFLVYLVDQYH